MQMNNSIHRSSVVAATLAWLRGHTLLAVFGVLTGLALAVAAVHSLLTGSVLPFVFFLILGTIILSGIVRLGGGGQGNKGEHGT